MALPQKKSWRVRAAILIAATYALCVLAPPMAYAFTSGPRTIHCLENQHGIADQKKTPATHAHADGAAHQHHGDPVDQQDGKAYDGSCCGLFCMAGLAHDPATTMSRPDIDRSIVEARNDGLGSRAPDSLIRPPIA